MKRQTIATTYGTELARWVAALDREAPCHLVVVEGDDMGRGVALGAAPVVVGAATGCDLQLRDPRVSGRHVEVSRTEGGFRVKDLGSTNGVRYGGATVTEVELAAGATFVIGHTPLRIQPIAQAIAVAPSPHERFGELVGKSLAMREVFAVLELAAASDVTVLVTGETGTGKELVARALHEAGARRKGPFVALDCGALPDGLVESALFGHARGAFTGADRARVGAFARAHGGTLLLDEIGNLPLAAQARLLRALETRRVRPVGADDERDVDVRVVAAANQDLEAAARDGRFRPDLFYRLAVVTVTLPPLRARPDDVAPIAAALLRARGFEPGEMGGAALAPLLAHDWPGNVRELRNVLDRALALSPDAAEFDDLRLFIDPRRGLAADLAVRTDRPFGDAKRLVVEAFERAYLAELFRRHEGNVSAMARDASMDRKHLAELLDRHGIRR